MAKKIGLSDVFEAVGKFEAGLISEEELEHIENDSLPQLADLALVCIQRIR